MKLDKLKGKIVENKLTYLDCSKALNLSVTSFSNKINGGNRFTVPEANELANLLKLTNVEKLDIFFN